MGIVEYINETVYPTIAAYSTELGLYLMSHQADLLTIGLITTVDLLSLLILLGLIRNYKEMEQTPSIIISKPILYDKIDDDNDKEEDKEDKEEVEKEETVDEDIINSEEPPPTKIRRLSEDIEEKIEKYYNKSKIEKLEDEIDRLSRLITIMNVIDYIMNVGGVNNMTEHKYRILMNMLEKKSNYNNYYKIQYYILSDMLDEMSNKYKFVEEYRVRNILKEFK